MRPSLALVVWMDAAFDLDQNPGLVEVRTVGWVTHRAADYLTVAGERVGESAYRGFTAIPHSCIVSEEILDG